MFDRFSLRHSPALPNHSSGSPGRWKHTAPFGLDLGPNDAPPPLTVFVLTQSKFPSDYANLLYNYFEMRKASSPILLK
ncbi:hypothetical protein T03_5127 [Trichinella britovi]|uniref:Uncharacterized protein n=1 Tax=Trichinella britovi TaxID=45882 RepID=A0A0V1D7I9_TRIBR|nr:hypothetical protein T03_5127 [Trichinella britovi]